MRRVKIGSMLVVLAGGIAAAQTPDFHYMYFKQMRSMALDTSRVATFDAVGARSIVQIAGVLGETGTQLPIPGLTLRAVAEDSRSAETVRGIVSAAAVQARERGDGPEFVSPVFFGTDGGPVVVTRDLLVGFREDLAPARAREIIESLGAGVVLDEAYADTLGLFRVRSASRDGFEVLEMANRLAALPEVEYAEPDMIFTGHSDLVPNDTFFTSCWHLRNTAQYAGGVVGQDMEAVKAWDISTGVSSIIDVIIDAGVDPTHPDLNQVAGTDTTSNGGDGSPKNACDKHGTAVAGCVSAKINNALGVPGLAPNTRIASARTFISSLACDGSWSSSASWTVNSLAFAQTIGARVTNNSNGYGFTSSTIDAKYSSTKAAGIVHFASAGNSGASSIGYPASVASVNAVAALDVNGQRVSFSQFGTGLDFSAPGVSIATTDWQAASGYNGTDYVSVNGTSFASPLTSAAAALVLSYKPSLTAVQVEKALQQGCRNIGPAGYDTGTGWGFVDAYRSLERVRCPSDLNFDGIVEDGDFVVFVTSYDLLVCTDPAMPLVCSADVNGDGVVNDTDFVIFVLAYNTLVCP